MKQIRKVKSVSPVCARVIDTLTSTSSTDALSANMGRELNDKIDNLGPGVDETRLVNIENTLSSIEVALKELSTYKENTL